MEPFKSVNVTDQFIAYLRVAISNGELTETMPGIRRLAATHGVSSNTVTAALEQLTREGFLKPQGHGRRSRIVLPDHAPRQAFRITLLPYERADTQLDFVVEFHRWLKQEGYDVSVADKSLVDMKMNVRRIAEIVEHTETDAWIVFSAPEEVLEWFVSHSLPTFALFGRFRRLPIAATGLDKVPAFRNAIRRLVELGHRRIVLLQPKHNRLPSPARLVRESIAELEALGIKTGPYNLPDWEPSPVGLRNRLDSLFAVSPPTAIILDRPNEMIATQHYLAQRGIFAPRDISLICDYDPTFEWFDPAVCCIRWANSIFGRRILRWVGNVASGKDDRRQSLSRAKFVEKNTIGPAPDGK